MSVKQDRTGARTAVDLERKYNFGRTFREILGLIDDSRDKVEKAESSLRSEITQQVTSLRRDTETIVANAKKEVKTELEGDITELESKFAEIELDADGIIAKVSTRLESIESDVSSLEGDIAGLGSDITYIEGDISNLEGSVSTLEQSVEMKVSAEDVTIMINNKVSNGTVDSVETGTGYRLDSDGLTISKTGDGVENKIDNEGMSVTREGVEVLTASKDGVNAMNLHAKTYLIIGAGDGRSRFEDYGSNRTGCFWIGG